MLPVILFCRVERIQHQWILMEFNFQSDARRRLRAEQVELTHVGLVSPVELSQHTQQHGLPTDYPRAHTYDTMINSSVLDDRYCVVPIALRSSLPQLPAHPKATGHTFSDVPAEYRSFAQAALSAARKLARQCHAMEAFVLALKATSWHCMYNIIQFCV